MEISMQFFCRDEHALGILFGAEQRHTQLKMHLTTLVYLYVFVTNVIVIRSFATNVRNYVIASLPRRYIDGKHLSI
jgi:hypothetical protein